MKDPLELLRHIKNECEFLAKTSGTITKDAFLEDEVLRRAYARSLEIIGEAAKNISEAYKKQHPDMDWKGMAGMRDVLIHGYIGVDYVIVWDVVRNHIPLLSDNVGKLLLENTKDRKNG